MMLSLTKIVNKIKKLLNERTHSIERALNHQLNEYEFKGEKYQITDIQIKLINIEKKMPHIIALLTPLIVFLGSKSILMFILRFIGSVLFFVVIIPICLKITSKKL